MSAPESRRLRILVTNARTEIAQAVEALGHEVIAHDVEVADVGQLTVREQPDVALVGLGESSEQALQLVDEIVREAICPVIVIVREPAPWFINEAAKRGIFAYVTDRDPQDWQSSIDIVLRRFAEYQSLEEAFGRRAVIERAKGILMERHSIDEREAFRLLRAHARRTGSKLVDVAAAVVESRALLPRDPSGGPDAHGRER